MHRKLRLVSAGLSTSTRQQVISGVVSLQAARTRKELSALLVVDFEPEKLDVHVLYARANSSNEEVPGRILTTPKTFTSTKNDKMTETKS